MKTRLLMISMGLLIFLQIPQIYAPPSENPDWQNYPYCPGGCSHDYLKKEWAKYYDIKGAEWMENKKQEMFAVIENGTLDAWLADPTWANSNVHTYYFYKGEVTNSEDKYIDQVEQERFFSDMEQNLRNNNFPLGEHLYINFTLLLVIIVGFVVGIIFVIKRKRK